MVYSFIALGAGQCSSVLPFMKDWLVGSIKYDEIIFCDTGKELPLTYAHLDVLKNYFDITVLDTPFDYSHPPICTKELKILPVRRYLRSKGINEAIKYLGITWEEKRRVKENSVKWIKNNYPLVELELTRKSCQEFLFKKLGYIPPRSGCITCKYFDRQHLVPNYLTEGGI